jgi:hypothetical protein
MIYEIPSNEWGCSPKDPVAFGFIQVISTNSLDKRKDGSDFCMDPACAGILLRDPHNVMISAATWDIC